MNEISFKLNVMVRIWRARCLWAQQQQEKTGRAGPHLIQATNERDKLQA